MSPPTLELLRPEWLWALLPLALLLVAGLRTARHGDWRSRIDLHLIGRLRFLPGRGASAAPWLLGLGWLLAVLALAGPSWQQAPPATYRTGTPLVVAVALGASMDRTTRAERVETVQIRLHDLLGGWTHGAVGLVAFAGSSHVVAPLTDDARAIAQLAGRLDASLMPRPGVLAAPALELAGALLAGYGPGHGDVLLVADAVDDPAAATAAAERLREAGHRVSVAALDGEALAALAAAGGGRLLPLGGDGMRLAGSLGDAGWWSRSPAETDPERAGEPLDGGVWLIPLLLPLVLFAFRRGMLLPAIALLALLPPPAEAGWWARDDRSAAAALAGGATDVDPRALDDPAWQGVALYRAGRYAEAARAFRLAGDLTSRYNRANALAHLGQYAQAVADYDAVLAADPGHAAARFNRAHVARLIEEEAEQDSESNSESDPSSAEPPPGEGDEEPDDRGDGEPQPPAADGAEPGAPEEGETPPDAPPGNPPPGETPTAAELAEREADEAAQAMRQWLSTVPDDPGGLLRERFAREWRRSAEADR